MVIVYKSIIFFWFINMQFAEIAPWGISFQKRREYERARYNIMVNRRFAVVKYKIAKGVPLLV